MDLACYTGEVILKDKWRGVQNDNNGGGSKIWVIKWFNMAAVL